MAKQSITYESFRQEINAKRFAPVYLFYGEESFLASEATDLIIEKALRPEERGFNLDIVYGNEISAREVVSHSSSYPMMADRRVVVVRGLERMLLPEKEKEILSGYLENPLQSTVLVLVASSLDMRKKPFFHAKKHGIVLEFKSFYDNQIVSWISRRVKDQGYEIEDRAVTMLAEYVNPSLREIQNELDKLYIYIGSRKTIRVDDVTELVGASKEYNVFALQKSIGEKDLARSIDILDRMLEMGESPTTIIAMLTRYFVALWKIAILKQEGSSNSEQAQEAGVHPFFLRDYHVALSSFGMKDIELQLNALAAADERLKTTSSDPKEVMQVFVVQALSRPVEAVA